MISNPETGDERGQINLHCWFFETPALYAQLLTADHCRTADRKVVGGIKKNPGRMLFVQNSVYLWCTQEPRMLRFDCFERLVFSITYLESIPTGNPPLPAQLSCLLSIIYEICAIVRAWRLNSF
jgi:hypothetical protein